MQSEQPVTLESERVLSISDIESSLQKRIPGLNAWLETTGIDCKNEQRHCEDGTVERVYWHYGYMVALRDALNLIKQNSQLLS